MGSAAPPNSQASLATDEDRFELAYQRWRQLYDYEPSPEADETIERFEARADRLGEEFRRAEQTVLQTQPTGHVQIIAMLDVISGAEEVGPDQRAALCSIRSALAPGALREAGQGFYTRELPAGLACQRRFCASTA